MRNKLWNGMVAGVLGGALIAGAMGGTSCSDNNSSSSTAGTGGTSSAAGGHGGGAGFGFDAGANTNVYSVQLSSAKVVPTNPSTATGTVVVTLDRTSGAVNVAGSYIGLSSNATAAAIRGPAASGSNAAVLISLTVPSTSSGTVSGSGTMTGTQMSDMTGGMTYVSISSVNYPDGEIRAQIVP